MFIRGVFKGFFLFSPHLTKRKSTRVTQQHHNGSQNIKKKSDSSCDEQMRFPFVLRQKTNFNVSSRLFILDCFKFDAPVPAARALDPPPRNGRASYRRFGARTVPHLRFPRDRLHGRHRLPKSTGKSLIHLPIDSLQNSF